MTTEPTTEQLRLQLSLITDLLEQDEAETPEIVQRIQRIPALEKAILTRVNSTEFGLAHSIQNVTHAIAMMGSRRTLQTLTEFRHLVERQVIPAPHLARPSVEKRTGPRSDPHLER